MLFETATLRSGYQLTDTKAYGDRIERMLRLSMNVDLSEQVCPPRRNVQSASCECLCGVWPNVLCSCVQVEEEPEEEAEEPAEDADPEDEEEVQADDDDAEEESVSVPSSLLVSQYKL